MPQGKKSFSTPASYTKTTNRSAPPTPKTPDRSVETVVPLRYAPPTPIQSNAVSISNTSGQIVEANLEAQSPRSTEKSPRGNVSSKTKKRSTTGKTNPDKLLSEVRTYLDTELTRLSKENDVPIEKLYLNMTKYCNEKHSSHKKKNACGKKIFWTAEHYKSTLPAESSTFMKNLVGKNICCKSGCNVCDNKTCRACGESPRKVSWTPNEFSRVKRYRTDDIVGKLLFADFMSYCGEGLPTYICPEQNGNGFPDALVNHGGNIFGVEVKTVCKPMDQSSFPVQFGNQNTCAIVAQGNEYVFCVLRHKLSCNNCASVYMILIFDIATIKNKMMESNGSCDASTFSINTKDSLKKCPYVPITSTEIKEGDLSSEKSKKKMQEMSGVFIGHLKTRKIDRKVLYALETEEAGIVTVGTSDPMNLLNRFLERIRDYYRCLGENYSNFTIAGEQNEGNKTLSENVADIVGIKMAYDAFISSKNNVKLPGLSNIADEQLFYIAAGQNWCSRYHMDTIKATLDANRNGESHTINPNRVVAMMAQYPEFQQAFKCSATSKMDAQKKCTLWKR